VGGYRKNVAAFLLNDKGQILLCQRSDEYKTWQLPQGGVDAGEDLEHALLRELKEEIGTNDIELIHQLENSICYDWPEHARKFGYIGQEQTYFLANLIGKVDFEKAIDKEFISSTWVNSEEFKLRVSGFKKDAYIKALDMLKNKFPEIIK